MKASARAILVTDKPGVWILVMLQIFLAQLMIRGIYMRCKTRTPPIAGCFTSLCSKKAVSLVELAK